MPNILNNHMYRLLLLTILHSVNFCFIFKQLVLLFVGCCCWWVFLFFGLFFCHSYFFSMSFQLFQNPFVTLTFATLEICYTQRLEMLFLQNTTKIFANYLMVVFFTDSAKTKVTHSLGYFINWWHFGNISEHAIFELQGRYTFGNYSTG